MRVSVTISDEMNQYFKELAEKQGISKDKVIGQILASALTTKHNERGAGRKSIFSEVEVDKMKEYRNQGYTYKQLSEKFKCSVGLVHKLINE